MTIWVKPRRRTSRTWPVPPHWGQEVIRPPSAPVPSHSGHATRRGTSTSLRPPRATSSRGTVRSTRRSRPGAGPRGRPRPLWRKNSSKRLLPKGRLKPPKKSWKTPLRKMSSRSWKRVKSDQSKPPPAKVRCAASWPYRSYNARFSSSIRTS